MNPIAVPLSAPLLMVLGLGVIAGAGIYAIGSTSLIRAATSDEPGAATRILALIAAIVASPLIVLMSLVAVEAGAFTARQAVVVAILGVGGLLVAFAAAGRLAGGESLQIESHWGGIGGGFGGGLGGWRVNPATALSLAATVLFLGAVAGAMWYDPPLRPTPPPPPAAAKPAVVAPATAPTKPTPTPAAMPAASASG